MSEIITLLIEISALLETCDAAWTDDIKVNTCRLMQQMLSDTCLATSFVVHDSEGRDAVSVCLNMTQATRYADGDAEFANTLRAKLQLLTSKCICMALHTNRRCAVRGAVDEEIARNSLIQQLQL